MAVQTINYSVTPREIIPNTEQQVGLQHEDAATELKFTINDVLYGDLLEGDYDVKYRFDCYDGLGGSVSTPPKALVDPIVFFPLKENLTRSGGKARVYLVVTKISDGETVMEFRSFPAKLRFENVPESEYDNGPPRESLTTLAVYAGDAAERAEAAAGRAETAQGKTEQAAVILEGDTEFFFDGGDASSDYAVGFVLDGTLNKASNNAISNKAVATEFEEVDGKIENRELAENKSDVLPDDITDADAKKKYPSLKLIKDAIASLISAWFPTNEPAKDVVIEQGVDGIWTYRKWASGISECWGITSKIDLTGGTSLSQNLYVKSTENIKFPNGLFIGNPVASINTFGKMYCHPTIKELNKEHISSYLITTGSATENFNTYGFIQAKGIWKETETNA